MNGYDTKLSNRSKKRGAAIRLNIVTLVFALVCGFMLA
jgi:hypothetical protein